MIHPWERDDGALLPTFNYDYADARDPRWGGNCVVERIDDDNRSRYCFLFRDKLVLLPHQMYNVCGDLDLGSAW